MSTRRQLFVFDCFGTLVFTREGRPSHRNAVTAFVDLFDCDQNAAKSFIYPLVAQAWLPDTAALDVDAHVAAASESLCVDRDEVDAFIWRTFAPGPGDAHVPPGARELLRHLGRSDAEVRMLSNCVLAPAQMRRMLDELEILDCFDAILLSSEGRGKKPEPAFFEEALAGDFHDVVVVGDSERFDLAPASAMGARTQLVESPQSWEVLRTTLRTDPAPASRKHSSHRRDLND